MAQQTAVEWYSDILLGLMIELATGVIVETEYHIKRRKAFEQAKQMEKEQIVRSYCDGFYRSGEGWNGEYGLKDIENIAEEINAEQYYNETFTSTPQGETPSATRTGQF